MNTSKTRHHDRVVKVAPVKQLGYARAGSNPADVVIIPYIYTYIYIWKGSVILKECCK